MESHTDAAASHSKLSNTSLEECAREVALGEGMSLLQETVCLIGVRKVGRSTNHIRNLLCKNAKTCSRSRTCSIVVLLYTLAPINLWSLAAKPFSLSSSLLWVSISPSLLFSITFCADSLELLSTVSVHFLNIVEDNEWILWVATKMLDSVDVSVATKRSTMGLAVSFVRSTVSLQSTLTHNALTDDEGWLAFYLLSSIESLTNLVYIVAADFDDFPSESTVLSCCIFVHNVLSLCRELDVVRVVEHDEVVETESSCYTSATL